MSRSAGHAPADYRHRPERPVVQLDWLERLQRRVVGRLELHPWRLKLRQKRFLAAVRRHSQPLGTQADSALLQRARELGTRMRQQGFNDHLLAEQFAIIREISGRVLGMRHFDSQLTGGWIMVQGRIAEMKTGEGKTLTAVLPVIAVALAGLPVHVITVNDYLTARDAEEMAPLYRWFGLSLGVVTHEVDPVGRRAAYQSDIVYITGKELVFDYLRDQMKLTHQHPLRMQVAALKSTRVEAQLQLRGLHFALVDEADSVLIDESRTPLIISGVQGNEEEQRFIETGWRLSFELQQDHDFLVDRERRHIDLTEAGRNNLQRLSETLGPLWKGAIRREEIIHKALLARFIYQLDKDYLVREGKIELIDPLSGRVMEGRSWEKGLHQMVELKEECELTQQRVTLARISYQNFFRRYLHLSGMTGTAWEVKDELWRVYGLAVSRVKPNRREQRKELGARVFATDQERWQAVVEHSRRQVEQGRAVLIGTASVSASETASASLKQAGLAHYLLSAKQDKQEAEIVAAAGQPGRITVATNMAGRGTDIKLAPEVKQAGGLHVILTEHYESSRVDRQLAGRCARQGDPGSFEMLLSLEDQPLRSLRGKSLMPTCRSLGLASRAGQQAARNLLRAEQQFVERQNYLARQSTLEYDHKQKDLLAFAGSVD
ncbi:preprotein translocase subunit SecA [Amphritea pacifica]|uniref:preprotein translocase subunit SecA n=1 Tax=Amphritea pacifica TaxID=2811233 RepID=UPI00196626BB|nr:preprotein translocase subunit SecA [Amphritea pacifica]MBN1006131.1 preprotein translocase subunit SecA [Amphritea pacifica]